jgi:hypothetical protein
MASLMLVVVGCRIMLLEQWSLASLYLEHYTLDVNGRG